MRRPSRNASAPRRCRQCRLPTVFADAPSPRYGCVLYVTHIAAVNWVLNCALTDGAAFVLFGAKIAAGGAQKAKMVMTWVEHRGTLAGLVLFFHQVGELQRHRVNLNRPLKLK